MKKKLIIFRLFGFAALMALSTISIAQITTALPTHIRENLTLENGVYSVKGMVYAKKGTTVTLGPGVTLRFGPDAALRIDGSIISKGEPNKLVTIESEDFKKPGNGIVVKGVSTSDVVEISYSRFNHLKKPLSFEFRWSRASVDIKKNVFKNSHFDGAAIQVQEIDNLLTEERIQFGLNNNTFCNNTSSILLSNITSDLLSISFNGNVVTRNSYTGRKRNGIFTSPLFMTYNKYQKNETPSVSSNSIFDNFYSIYFNEEALIGRTNISVIGNADKLDLSNNYFGQPRRHEIEETFDFVSANYSAPYLYTDNILERPSKDVNGHFYDIKLNGAELMDDFIFEDNLDLINHIQFTFNRSVVEGSDFKVVYHYLASDSIYSVNIPYDLKWSDNNTKVKVSITEKFKKVTDQGFLEINGFYDSEGIDVPTLFLGRNGIRDPRLRTYIPQNNATTIISENDKEEVVSPTESIDFESILNATLVNLKQNYFDFGVFVGNSIYFGDVNRTAVTLNPRHMKPNGGIRFGYQVAEKFRVEVLNHYMIIAGSDRGNNLSENERGTHFERNLSFRTTIIDASLMMEYNLVPFKKITTFVPSVFTGAGVYYFKPMGQVEGSDTWYDLRSIGTEGQTLNGTQNQYKKIMFSVPYGVSIKRHLTQNTVVSLSYTYNKIFTDYLDDISVGTYPDSQALENANPDLGDIAVQLSNPGNQSGQRSYSSKNDGYGFWGLGFTFKIQ